MSACTVYRLRDAAGDLLYVGMTHSAMSRLAHHSTQKPWWPDVSTVDVEHIPSRAHAADAEAEALRTENPAHNIQGVSGTARQQRRAEREAERDARFREREAAKREAKKWFPTPGTIGCLNCDRLVEFMWKGTPVEETPCARCGLKLSHVAPRKLVAKPGQLHLVPAKAAA